MINITESPIKPVVNLEDSIVVYVPGYSSYGPAEPTLCSSVSEFEGLFGSTPYLFEEDQKTSGISKGSPEKGYLYAKALLGLGLTVLFHRFKHPEAKIAQADFKITYDETEYDLAVVADSFGKAYKGIKISLKKNSGNLYNITVTDNTGVKVYSDIVSFDPQSSLYFKTTSIPLINFKAKSGEKLVDIEDSLLLEIIKKTYEIKEGENSATSEEITLTLAFTEEDENKEFYLDDETKGLLTALSKTDSNGLMYPLTDFERYPTVTYLTTGGYYTNKNVAAAQLTMAETIKAVALVDLKDEVNDQTTWNSFKETLAAISGTTIAKGKAAAFKGCNSFNISPYRVVLGDSFNYLTCLGQNLNSGVKAWIPVANDPNGVSPYGYDTTSKIDTALSETIGEGKIGVCANPIIYSNSAGGYKIMGNRTLLSNDGVLSPNSFLNIAVIVNRVERAARQTANKLKIVSTNPEDTFNKFRLSVEKTITPMESGKDGILSHKIRHLPKTAPATIDIEISLVVLEGLETFNINIPYSLNLE